MLAFPKRSWHSGLKKHQSLKRLSVDGGPALRSITLRKPLYYRLPRSRSTRRFERWIVKHARSPNLLWTASPAWRAPMTATASGSLRGWIDLGRECILQSIIYAAFTCKVTGAVLGPCVFRASFGRVFVLSNGVIAMEDIRTLVEREATDRVLNVLDASGFSDFVTRMKDESIEERLPYTFLREEEGANDNQLEAPGSWAHAAYRLMLGQPRNGQFARQPPVKSALVTELSSPCRRWTAGSVTIVLRSGQKTQEFLLLGLPSDNEVSAARFTRARDKIRRKEGRYSACRGSRLQCRR